MSTAESGVSIRKKNDKAIIRFFVFCFIFIVVDQLVKYLVFTKLTNLQLQFANITGLELFSNNKFAFSIPLPPPVIFLVYGTALVVIVLYVWRKFFSLQPLAQWAWLLIIAGGVSNFGERIFTGAVKDFIWVYGNGIFNIADCYIILGIIFLFVVELRGTIKDRNKRNLLHP